MKKLGPIIIVIILIVVGLLIVNKQKSQELMIEADQSSMMKTTEKDVQKITTKVQQAAQDTAADVQSMDAVKQSKIKELLAKAAEQLKSGDYQGAIVTAQEILTSYDPNSSEAKSIIEKAKEAIKKLADQKAEELKGQAAEKVGDLKGALGGFKQ